MKIIKVLISENCKFVGFQTKKITKIFKDNKDV